MISPDTITSMLFLYRRHTPKCRYRKQSPEHVTREQAKCSCPVWVDGTLNGERIRKSLKTRDWGRAGRKLAEMENPQPLVPEPEPAKMLADAIAAFLEANKDRAHGTMRNDRRILRHLERIGAAHRVPALDAITLEFLDEYRAERPISSSTWTKELQVLRHFLGFCHDRGWVAENAAKRVRTPRVKPNPKDPYTSEEIVRILAACDRIGAGTYERLRARAMVLLLRYTALRVSDIATLQRTRIRDGYIHLHTMKTGQPVRLPVPPDLSFAIENLPVPRGTMGDSKHFFWSGNGTTRAVIRDVTRTLARVFELSGVPGAHAHRFRHTLATEILLAGGSVEDAADVLGNSPNVIRRHYAQWTIRRQERIEGLLRGVFSGTFSVQTKNEAVTDSKQSNLSGGRHGIRTHDPHVANVVLSQLS